MLKLLLSAALWTVLAGARALAQEPGPPVRLNTIGFLPAMAKKASILNGVGTFVVRSTSDESVVFEGDLSEPAINKDTQELLAVADFSALARPGQYVLEVQPHIRSAPFEIAADVYSQPFFLAMQAMYLWRCGTSVEATYKGERFAHDACHTEDAFMDDVGGGHVRRDSVGGWHDAGDYNKYVVNAGATVGVMLCAWDDFEPKIRRVQLHIPEGGRDLPAYLAEIKWELDWLLTMQADNGSVYHKVSTRRFGGFIDPSREDDRRYFVPWSSAATADFVAMLSKASSRFAPYDAAYSKKCLAAAKKSYAFLQAHPEPHRSEDAGFLTGGYQTPDWDDRLWAEAEFWEATGDGDVLKSLETRLRQPTRFGAPTQVDADWDWSNVRTLGLITYVNSKRAGRDQSLVARIRDSLIETADDIAQTARQHGYGRPLGQRYYWGANGTVARQALVLNAAFRLTREEKYRETALAGVDHLFGRNTYGRSFVTGLGYRPPIHPHDRRSGSDDIESPWPGYLVGGPHPLASSWRDEEEDYRQNEIAINWNAALIYSLAMFLPADEK